MSDRARPAPELGRQWNNVAIGTLAADGTIEVNWMDVPRGGILGGGTLTLRAQADMGPATSKSGRSPRPVPGSAASSSSHVRQIRWPR